MTGFGPFNPQDRKESSQISQQQVPIPSSYHISSFNQEQVSNVFCPGLVTTQPVIPPVPSFDGNKKDDNSNSFLANSQWSNGQGDLNRTSEGGKEKRKPAWQRLKWTDEMVKVLITAVSYVEEDAILYVGLKNEMNKSFVPIKGKWKAISKAMAEKGYFVSPQQCEDKFNDLNKKYKRLNDILGKGTTCETVKNPTLIELVNISEEAKEEAMKLVGCKHLFYQEMCSFHNKNKKYLPHDEHLQKLVQFALKGKVKYMSKNLGLPIAKRQKQGDDIGVSERFDNYPPTNAVAELTDLPFGVIEDVEDQDRWMISRSLELEEKALLIKKQMLELEENKIEWLKSREKEDMELKRMKVENELLKLENERLAYMLRCQKKGL